MTPGGTKGQDGPEIDVLHGLLEAVDGKVPTQRVLAVIGRKQGDSIPRLAVRHGVSERTIHNWLSRFANRPLEHAPYDTERAGRPAELPPEQRARLLRSLRRSPNEVGYEAEEWDVDLARHYIREQYNVEYSNRHVRRLMAAARSEAK